MKKLIAICATVTLMRAFILSFAFFGFMAAAIADVTYSDGDWDPANWESIKQYGNGSISTSVVSTGGNTGRYMRVDYTNYSWEIQAFHFYRPAVYDPANGAIDRITWSVDARAIQNFYGNNVAVILAAEQNGIRYLVPGAGGLNNNSSWVTFADPNPAYFPDPTLCYVASNFMDFPRSTDFPPNPGHPDFSASGSPIRFGFCTQTNNTDLWGSRATGFDNWSVTIHTETVPEPATLLLLGLGGLVLRKRK
jgi:hypothetical protein